MCEPNLHITFNYKLERFLRKSILIWKNINLQDVLKGLNFTKFLEILHNNTTPYKVSSDQLKLLLSIHILCTSHFKFV